MNVLVILEDFRKDQYIKPIVTAIFTALDKPGKAKAKIIICRDPLLRGISQALKWENIEEIVARYPMTNIFLLCVDRDCQIGRRAELDHLENKVKTETLLKPNQVFLGECAWQELEVWILAGLNDLPNSWEWKVIRQDCNPKETYYLPYAEQRGVAETLGEGRKILGEEAAKNYSRLRQLCPEDIGHLEQRLEKLQW
jgi:hypothetical protein